MATKDSQFHCGHRERLRQKFLDDKLAEYERLELLLAHIVPRRDVRPLAHALLNKFGSISQIITTPYDELVSFPGVGRSIAIFMKLIHQIILDGYRTHLEVKPVFHDVNAITDYCRWSFANKSVEEFHVLYLDSDHRLLQDELHSTGTFNSANVYAREIVKHALKLNATAIILVHNHPTTDNTFSNADIETTKELDTLFKSLGITLYDHFVVSKGSVYSARNSYLI